MKNKKRVLIVNNHSFKEDNSTGLTLRSIINYFDSKDVLEVYYYPIPSCVNNNEINSLMLKKKTKIIYNIFSKIYKGKIKNDISKKIVDNEIKNHTSFLKKIKTTILAIDDWMEPKLKCNEDILQKIHEFKPEVIYTLGASIFSLNIANYFSDEYKIPIVLHHMDNWRETTYSRSPIMKYPRKKLLYELEKVESKMNYGMTISDEMARIYEQISGKNYLSLMHTVEINTKPFIKVNNTDEFNFVYAGGLHLERWKALREIEKAITALNITNKKVYLNIFTKKTDKAKYSNQFNETVVKFHDFLPHNEIDKISELADILVHVESFDPEIVNFTKFSLSTKIPEYFASGRPILCYAPITIASSQYITNSKSGISVSDYEELITAIEKLIGDESLRDTMGKNGIDVALKKHSETYKNKIMSKVFEVEYEKITLDS